ncbi:hypothetical protein V8G54_002043 [Vigna mungo]|uniref:Uncharacterized protein n=1 Tax=Vigna mungo TaxID=3915 RepID=A0AAQ3S8R5_VIGMU
MVVFPVPVSPTKSTGSLYLTEHAICSKTCKELRISTKGLLCCCKGFSVYSRETRPILKHVIESLIIGLAKGYKVSAAETGNFHNSAISFITDKRFLIEDEEDANMSTASLYTQKHWFSDKLPSRLNPKSAILLHHLRRSLNENLQGQ